MTMWATDRTVRDAWARLGVPAAAAWLEPFTAAEMAGAPGPVRRYFTSAVVSGTPLAYGARLEMRGRIKMRRWLLFRARQLLVPRHGTVWIARVGGVIV